MASDTFALRSPEQHMSQDPSLATDGEAGWRGPFRVFVVQSVAELLTRLMEFIPDASAEQVDAWKKALPQLQEQAGRVIAARPEAGNYAAILEYLLPLEARRPDVIFLYQRPGLGHRV
jgi:hypothetical protein